MIKLLFHLKNSLLLVLCLANIAFAVTAGLDSVDTFGVENPDTPKDIAAFACLVVKLALDFIPYIVAIAVGAFLQGLVKYIRHGDNEEKRTEGIKMMIYGSLGFFFMVSVWGIMELSGRGLGIDLVIPQFNSSGSGLSSTCQ